MFKLPGGELTLVKTPLQTLHAQVMEEMGGHRPPRRLGAFFSDVSPYMPSMIVGRENLASVCRLYQSIQVLSDRADHANVVMSGEDKHISVAGERTEEQVFP